jgi:RES domain-containing protein
VILWRISNHVSLAGDGGLRASGRWHTRGRRIVYLAPTPSAALLEILVHLEIEVRDLPTRYRLLKVEAPDDLPVEHVTLDRLPADWTERTGITRPIGDAWLAQSTSALLSVPSAIVPETFNTLLNPAHQDASRLAVAKLSKHAIDPRLMR